MSETGKQFFEVNSFHIWNTINIRFLEVQIVKFSGKSVMVFRQYLSRSIFDENNYVLTIAS